VRAGDLLQTLDGVRVLTVADFAHVLEHAPQEAEVPLQVRRAGQTVRTTLHLAGDWRKTADPSWRSSTYLAGPNAGLWAVPLSDAEKRQAHIPADQLALRITFFFPGQDAPKKAGLQLGDVIVEVDGSRQSLTTRQLHTHCQMDHTYGDKLLLVVRRGDQELKVTLELPRKPAQLN
jgi:S1-C subfamily serine protease